jgi:hypothetical protein
VNERNDVDAYEQKLAEWKAKHGITHADGSDITVEDMMQAEDAKDPGKAYCWRCTEQFPIREMLIDTDPYIQDEDRPQRDDGYIPKAYRVRTCKPCHEKAERGEE